MCRTFGISPFILLKTQLRLLMTNNLAFMLVSVSIPWRNSVLICKFPYVCHHRKGHEHGLGGVHKPDEYCIECDDAVERILCRSIQHFNFHCMNMFEGSRAISFRESRSRDGSLIHTLGISSTLWWDVLEPLIIIINVMMQSDSSRGKIAMIHSVFFSWGSIPHRL